ncbi:MAG: hypothetical protein HUU55_07270 [Myxococcales bacterium]|nr:hypothetical protein [Myxococcales bacterium]
MDLVPKPSHGVGYSLLFATLVFAALLFIPHHTSVPEIVDPIEGPPNCPSVRWSVLDAECRRMASRTDLVQHRCEPTGGWDADWEIQIRFETDGDTQLLGPFAFDAAGVDFRHARVVENQYLRRYEGFDCDEEISPDWPPANFRKRCTLRGAPYRTYTIVTWCDSGSPARMAMPALQFQFYQPSGQNVRWSSLGQFGALALVGFLIAFAGFRLRPGGPVFRAFGLPRWAAIVIHCLWGGMAAGLIFALRPADFGGKDTVLVGNAPFEVFQVTGVVVLCGLFADVLRRSYATLSPKKRTIVVAAALVFCIAMVFVVYDATSVKYREWNIAISKFKIRYYIYLCSALWLLLITTWPSEWRFLQQNLSGSLPPTADRAKQLFVYGMIVGVIINVVSIAVGDWLQVPNVGNNILGFYKPASAWGLLVSLLPAYFAMCVAVNLGEERPRWIQEIAESLARLYGPRAAVLPRRKAEIARSIVRQLLLHYQPATGFGAHRRFVTTIVGGCTTLVQSFLDSPEDMDQLAGELQVELSILQARLVETHQQLETIQGEAPRVERSSPLLLADAVAQAATVGEIRVSATVDDTATPGEFALVVRCNSQTIVPGSAFYLHVRSLVVRVGTLLGPMRSGIFPFVGKHVMVDFLFPTSDPRERFSGDSYELPLCLLLIEAATGIRPTVPWAATGKVDPTGEEIIGVNDVALKKQALSGLPPRLFVVALADARQAEDGDGMVLVDTGEMSSDTLRRQAAKQLQQGRPVVLAAPTLSALLDVLYPGLRFGG